MTFEDDVTYFTTVDERLKKEGHAGKFVLIKDHQEHGIFSNIEDAHKAALEKFGVSEVVIQQVGTSAPLNFLATATA